MKTTPKIFLFFSFIAFFCFSEATQAATATTTTDSTKTWYTSYNYAPIAKSFSRTTEMDRRLIIDLKPYIYDRNGDAMTCYLSSSYKNYSGKVYVNSTYCRAIYTPPSGYTRSTYFYYYVKDSKGAQSSLAKVSIDVVPPNNAPVAYDISVTTMQGTPVKVTPNAIDQDGDELSYSFYGLNGISEGLISSSDGWKSDFTFTPVEGFVGIAESSYIAFDSKGAQSTAAKVTITVLENTTTDFSVNEDAKSWIAFYDTDSTRKYKITALPSHGQLTDSTGAILSVGSYFEYASTTKKFRAYYQGNENLPRHQNLWVN